MCLRTTSVSCTEEPQFQERSSSTRCSIANKTLRRPPSQCDPRVKLHGCNQFVKLQFDTLTGWWFQTCVVYQPLLEMVFTH